MFSFLSLNDTLPFRPLNKIFNESVKNNLELTIRDYTTWRDVIKIASSKLAEKLNIPPDLIEKAKMEKRSVKKVSSEETKVLYPKEEWYF